MTSFLLLSALFIVLSFSFCQRDLVAGERSLKLKQQALLRSKTFGPFNGPTYEGLIRQKKAALLWQALDSDNTSLPWYSSIEELELFVEDMNLSFDNVGDDMPCQFFCTEERKKLIHTVGVLGKGKFVMKSNPKNYTGMFATGGDTIIIRMSLAAVPSTGDSDISFIPAIVVKYLRDGFPSGHTFAMYSLLGQSSYNYFKHDLSNHPPLFGSWASYGSHLLLDKFLGASQFPTMIGLSDFAKIDQDGAQYPNPTFPYRLVFHPVSKWHNYFGDDWPRLTFAEQLAEFVVPGPLYEIYAQDAPPFSNNNELFHIGTLELTSPLVSSQYGDRHFFMQHTRFETDLALRPDWQSATQQDLQNQANTPAPGFVYPDLTWS